ncbi:resuscitation-promoting factor RpfA isoform X2 [Cryptotermes secundus]|nr:resuscitation-promoting factor RpfA isoform X2 [Cryptotermes secundus]
MALATAKPGIVGSLPYAAVAPVGIATSVSSQYHAQDTLGQYSYGYAGGPSAKTETRTADGITRGGYSYIDGHGLVQSASYVSDPVNGFRVAATNLPVGPSVPAAPIAPIVAAAPAVLAAPAPIALPAVAAGAPLETPEVIAAKAAHFAAHAQAKALLGRKRRSLQPVAAPIASYAAAPFAAAPAAFTTYAAAPAPVAAFAAPAPIPVAKTFSYSTVSAHADPVVVAAPAPAISVARAAPVAFAAPAPVAVAAPAPVAVVEPVKSFGYSTVSAHADPVLVAAPAPAVSIARAAPVALAAPAPAVVAAPAPAVLAAPAPAFAVARAAPILSGSSQYQAQDTLGQYSYGYADSNSQKQEARAADGTTRGAYSYVDGHGLVQSVKYHADALGFRVAATNLPVGPA